ncbi:MAG TPA: hypothetical protein P5056_02965 [Candidatus Paceibacterota bacterium]|nr:hypothetical protein [Candidatus Paceibacterota bacterium]
MDKKLFAAIVAIVCLAGLAVIVIAVLAFCPARANANETKDIAYGAIASFVVHEAAHGFAAGNDEMTLHGPITNPKWEYKGRSGTYKTVYDKKTGTWVREYLDIDRYKKNLEGVSKAGMIGNDAVSHWTMAKNLRGKKRFYNMRKGFVAWNILNNAYYLTASKDRGDLDPANFRSEKHRERFKKIITVDTALLTYEFFAKRSIFPKGTSLSFKRRTFMFSKSWGF